MLFSEGGLSFRFTWPNWVRGIAGWIAWGVLLVALGAGLWGAAALAFVAIGLSAWSQEALQRAYHGPPIAVHQLWVPAVLPLIGGLVALAAKLNRRVDWRGRSYDLDGEARLGASGSPAGT
jgi:hypothetical protein